MPTLLASAIVILIVIGSALWNVSEIRAHADREKEQYRLLAENAAKEHEQLQKISLALGLVAVSDDLASLVATAFKERNDLKAANAELNQRHKRLDRSHTDLKDRHERVTAEKDHFETKTRNAVSKHSQVISSRLARNTSRQVATAPGKSIPFYGIAFVAGFALLDVYEACEMIKALNELNVEIGTQPDMESAKTICGLKVPSSEQLSAQLNSNWQAAYSSAATAANQAGKPFSATPPTVDPSLFSKQACSIFKGLWFCP